MPIWFELIVLLLTAYGVGVALGWLLWSREIARRPDDTKSDDEGKQYE